MARSSKQRRSGAKSEAGGGSGSRGGRDGEEPTPPTPAGAPTAGGAPTLEPAMAKSAVAKGVLGSRRVVWLPALVAVVLAAFALCPRSMHEPTVWATFVGAAALLVVWTAVLARRTAGQPRRLQLVIRRPHWMQPIAQLSIYVYWSMHWPEVGAAAHLIAAQVVFAYAFDMLLVWSRRDTYDLGFGPFPIIISVNLFLWFKPEWFYLQFAMIALGFAAKELIRWDKGDRRGHVFNPSSFPLAVVSVVLLLTSSTDLTWGPEIARTLEWPRHIYEWLFVISLPGQLLFGVALMPMAALVTAHGLSLGYFALFGTYFFVGPVPLAVFLGMLLLFTDPATAPRTDLGRIIYGVLYGAGVFIAYGLLSWAGLPTFYDKLLPVPLLNLSIRAIDRFASRPAVARFDPGRRLAGLRERPRYLLYTGVWALTFMAIRATQGVGDTHPSNRLPFWIEACEDGRRNGCKVMVTMESVHCERGSGWACNELGIYVAERRPDLARSYPPPASFRRACELGFHAGCANLQLTAADNAFLHEAPSLGDYDYLLETKALSKERTATELLDTACDHGWTEGCMGLGYYLASGQLTKPDLPQAATGFARACRRGNAEGCATIAVMYERGDGVAADAARAAELRARACKLGRASACTTTPAPPPAP